MTQVTSGLRAILSHASVYQWLQDLLGKKNRHIFVDQFIRATAGNRLLDVGCGTGNLLNYLPDGVNYVGMDLSSDYITAARNEHGEKGHFVCADVADLDYEALGKPDIVVAKGLLHHLSDDEVHDLFASIASVAKPETRLVTLDPCYLDSGNPLANWVISRDRGQNVRKPEAYRQLAMKHFQQVDLEVRTDLLRIPYSHAILQCSGPL
ncbi:MAG: class I SAM-dependent methyltransferase [endosymbiont of Escarpia spicata]|uniref:Class I SAM-dependent methyltransferase n=1 Tax=endosymbiont of Escarpia spicata TaxID=2200908 RepID=A0A370DGT8_9GAMM|nr:MAG: class I SAM-dependent methyltransferase [endosymbiont of Escarpia spicata]